MSTAASHHTSKIIPVINIRNNKIWIKDDFLIPVQVEPMTQPKQITKSQIAACGSLGIENRIPVLAVRACVAHYNGAEVHMMKMKFPVTDGSCAGMLLFSWPLASVNMTDRLCEWAVEIFYPWLDSKNSPAHAWCTGGHRDILFVFLSIPPCLAVVEIKTIPFDVSPAFWGWGSLRVSPLELWKTQLQLVKPH